MNNVAVVSEASLKEGCLYFDTIIPVFNVLRSESAMRELEYLKRKIPTPNFSEDILHTVLMRDVDPELTPEIMQQIMPLDASRYLAPIMKQITKGMQAAHVRWSFDQRRPEEMVAFVEGKLSHEEADQRMESLREMWILDSPAEYAHEYEETVESYAASLVQAYDLPFLTDSDNAVISKGADGPDPIISVKNLNLIDAETLSWEHILELKKDEASCNKLRRLRTFVRDNYEDKSQSYIEDDVSCRLLDYEETAQKWGLKLVKSSFQVIAESKSLLAAGSSSLAAACLGQPLASLAAISGGVAIELAHIVIHIISGSAEYKRQLANHPLAYIVEARSKVND